MIPGHPPNTTYRTIAQEDFGVPMCGSQEGCPRGLGWRAHWYGRVDRANTIHWKQADKRATRRGMRHLVKMMALVQRREWWTLPAWKKLQLTNVWAGKEIKRRYHYMVRASWSYQDRLESLRLVRRAKAKNLRRDDRAYYTWLLRAGLYVPAKVQSPSQEDDPPPE